MSVERYTGALPANGIVEFAGGNYALLLSASAAVNLRKDARGTSEGFNGVIGGILIKRVQPWENLRIIGTAGTTYEILIGSENVDQDETDIRLQIATIAGVASVSVQPASQFTSGAASILAASNQDFAADTTRKRITISVDSAATASVFVRDQAATTSQGTEVQPGTYVVIENTAALRIRNNSGVAVQVYWNIER